MGTYPPDASLDAINVEVKGDAQAVRQYFGTDAQKVWRNWQLAGQAAIGWRTPAAPIATALSSFVGDWA